MRFNKGSSEFMALPLLMPPFDTRNRAARGHPEWRGVTHGFRNSLESCTYIQYYAYTMITEEIYFWRIQWAGTWMVTRTRVSEQTIRQEHPEAIRVEESRQLVLTPETSQERMLAAARTRNASPDVVYRV